MRSTKMSDGKSMKGNMKGNMKGIKWIVVLLAVFLVAGAFVGAAGAFTVTYNGNGASGSAPTDTKDYTGDDVTVTVLGKGDLERTGFTFTGWNTAADGSGNNLAINSTFTITADTILYAQWTANQKFTVTYDDNGATSGSAPTDSTQYDSGATVTVLGNTGTLAKTGSTFAGWNTAADGSGVNRAVDSTFTITADTTLYAKWTANQKFTVTYDDNGATSGTVPMDSTQYDSGATVTALGNTGSLTKTGCTFAGWNTAADGSGVNHAENSTFTITADTTLYAQWTAETQEITSITVTGLTPLLPTQAISSKTKNSLTITSTTPSNHTGDLSVSSLSWKKAGTAVTTGNFEAGITYTAEFTLQPAANSNVTISPTAAVTVDGVRATYDHPTKKVIVNLQAGAKVSISAISLDVASTPAGEQNAPNITIASSDPNKDNLSISTTWKKKSDNSSVTGKLDYNTEYIATAEITVKTDKTAAYELASSVNVTKPEKTTDSPKTAAFTPSNGKITVSITFKTAVDKEIDTVSLTMNAPSAGNYVSTLTSLVTPETSANYTVYSLKWYSGTTELTTADKFESNKKYTAKIVLKTKDDYVFNSGISKSSVKVNSNAVDKTPGLTDSSKTLTLEYTFSETAKPVITLTANPASPKIGIGQSSVIVQFSYTITGDYSSASISFGDGSAASSLTSKSGTTAHTYTNIGTYTVTLSVKDASGVELSSKTLGFTIGKDSLTASFSATPASDNPQKISFAGTTAGNVTKWEWDLGDGTKTNEKSFTHIYKKAKDYTVTLTVYSGGLSDTTTRTVTVEKGSSAGDNEPFLIIGDTEVPSPLAIIAEFVHLLQSLFDFENHPLFPGSGE